MGKKGAMPIYNTVDDYLKHQSEEAQKLLSEIRQIIKETVPESVELTNTKVPTFKLLPELKTNQQIMVAAYANYLSFYPFPATIQAFSVDLKDFKLGKGSVNIPYDKPLPKNLIIQMILFRRDELLG